MAEVQRLFETESVDSLLTRFKRACQNEGVLREIADRDSFKTRSERRREKHARHLKRLRKRQRWLSRETER